MPANELAGVTSVKSRADVNAMAAKVCAAELEQALVEQQMAESADARRLEAIDRYLCPRGAPPPPPVRERPAWAAVADQIGAVREHERAMRAARHREQARTARAARSATGVRR